MSATEPARTYKVNEIFHSIQAEGRYAGRPAVFVRLAGCNLECPFCDTNHAPYTEMTRAQIEAKVAELDPSKKAIVVFTGGEPTLQLIDGEWMCLGRRRTIETNGIEKPPEWIRHVTISPKTKLSEEQLKRARELKFLYGWFDDAYLKEIEEFAVENRIPLYIQPMADAEGKFDPMPAIEFAKANPNWTVSLQFHKLINIQ